MNAFVKSNLPAIKALLKRYSVVRAFLFGSAAIDQMSEDSDVDFLITFDSALDYTAYGDNYFALMYALQDLLKRDVDLVTEKTLSNPYLLQKINSQKIALL